MLGHSLSRRRFVVSAAALGMIPLLPRTASARQDDILSADPMIAAEELSQLEVIEHIPALYSFYAHMHPDAQRIIPRATVIGWYHEDFQPQKPEPAVSTGVAYRDDWAWGVNGLTYPGVAEVSYTQAFGDGTTTSDVVRLAPYEGRWTWFFGRDQAWVDEQNYRFDQRNHVAQGGDAPFGLDGLATIDISLLNALPDTLPSDSATGTPLQRHDAQHMVLDEFATGGVGVQYYDAEYPVGYVSLQFLHAGYSPSTVVSNLVWDAINAPPMTLKGWNVAPAHATAWALIEHVGSDAVGMVQTVIIADKSAILRVSGRSDALITTLANELLSF